jgi:hypothetical protein
MTVNSAAHKRERKLWARVVARGEGWCSEPVCLMPDRWIHPDEPWDLSHNHGHADGVGLYLGPSHRKCNRSEGASRGNRARGSDYIDPYIKARWGL